MCYIANSQLWEVYSQEILSFYLKQKLSKSNFPNTNFNEYLIICRFIDHRQKVHCKRIKFDILDDLQSGGIFTKMSYLFLNPRKIEMEMNDKQKFYRVAPQLKTRFH